jgi:hypothetical protein
MSAAPRFIRFFDLKVIGGCVFCCLYESKSFRGLQAKKKADLTIVLNRRESCRIKEMPAEADQGFGGRYGGGLTLGSLPATREDASL